MSDDYDLSGFETPFIPDEVIAEEVEGILDRLEMNVGNNLDTMMQLIDEYDSDEIPRDQETRINWLLEMIQDHMDWFE